MRTALHTWLLGLTLVGVGFVAQAQDSTSTVRAPAASTTMLRSPLWTPPTFALAPVAPKQPRLLPVLAGPPPAGFADLSFFRSDPARDDLAAHFSSEPPQVTRAELDAPAGSGDTSAVRYHGLPGGIVLGLRARPVGELETMLRAGAQLGRSSDGLLVLQLADGRVLRLPAIDPATLRAELEFVTRGAGSHSLVDLCNERQRLAPAFAGTALESVLTQQDRVPHRLDPATVIWKSLITDRDVRMELQGGELRLGAELEVRYYSSFSAESAQCVSTRALACPEIAPLAEIAGWLGFLRWSVGADPRGLAALRTALKEP